VLPGAVVNGDNDGISNAVFDGINLSDNNKITNRGEIVGHFEGIRAGDGLTVINFGSITANETSVGGNLLAINAGQGVNITNNVGGIISGEVDALDGTVNNQGTMGPINFTHSNVASSISNDGAISAPTGSSAISFATGSVGNKLTLGTNSQITGQVLGAGSDILELGGSGLRTFDVSSIGSQYLGFSTFNKTGGSTWTLTGSGDQNWNISQGALVGDTNSLQGSNHQQCLPCLQSEPIRRHL
jgi:hypothetical protein